MQTNDASDHLLHRFFDVGQQAVGPDNHLHHSILPGKSQNGLLLAIAEPRAATATELADAVIELGTSAYLVDQIDSPDAALGFVENEAENRGGASPETMRDAVLILLSWVEDQVAAICVAEEKEVRRAIADGEAYEDGTSIPYDEFFDRYAAV